MSTKVRHQPETRVRSRRAYPAYGYSYTYGRWEYSNLLKGWHANYEGYDGLNKYEPFVLPDAGYRYWEKLTDVKYGGGKSIPKPTRHLKIRLNQIPGLPYLRDFNVLGGNGIWVLGDAGDEKWEGIVAPPPEVFVANRAFDAIREWSKTFPEVNSFANFAWELRELPSLLIKLKDAKVLANGYLAWSFGLKPLLSDIKKLQGTAQVVLDRLEWLRKNNNKWVKLNYTKVYTDADMLRLVGWSPVGPTAQEIRVGKAYNGWIIDVENFSFKFTAGAHVYMSVPGIERDVSLLKGFISALGLDNPGRIIWNALKYSFILEWVTNVVDRFCQPSIEIWNTKLEVRRFTHSVSYKGVLRLSRRVQDLTPPPFAEVTRSFGSVAFDYYDRRVGMPIVRPAPEFSSLTAQQQALLAALIAQRL